VLVKPVPELNAVLIRVVRKIHYTDVEELDGLYENKEEGTTPFPNFQPRHT